MGIKAVDRTISGCGQIAENIARHDVLLRQIHDAYVKKNHDYGDSFSRSFEKYGIAAAMIRMEDKWNQLDNLTGGAGQMIFDESVRGALLELADFAIMAVMELDRQNALEENTGGSILVNDEVPDSDSSVKPDLPENAVSVEAGEAEKVILHDEEKGDIEVNIPKALEKKPIDEGKVMALHKAKWSQKKIADEMGCSQGRISQIIKAHKE